MTRYGVLQAERYTDMGTPYSTDKVQPTEYNLWCDLYGYANDIKNETLRQKLQTARPHWHYVRFRTDEQGRISGDMGNPTASTPHIIVTNGLPYAGSHLYAPPRDEKPAEDKVYGYSEYTTLDCLSQQDRVAKRVEQLQRVAIVACIMATIKMLLRVCNVIYKYTTTHRTLSRVCKESVK